MRVTRFLLAALLLAVGVAGWLAVNLNRPTLAQGPDQTFRLINIERRLDQLQIRVDYVERAQQAQSLNTTAANATPPLVMELQRQQNSMAEQLVLMQRQMLELQKTIDRLSEKVSGQEKKPEEKPKPKPATGKP